VPLPGIGGAGGPAGRQDAGVGPGHHGKVFEGEVGSELPALLGALDHLGNHLEQAYLGGLHGGSSREREPLVCLCNFSPVVGKDHRVGLPRAGRWVEVLNTDDAAYGGSDVPDMGVVGAEELGWVGQPASARMTLPPLATVWLTPS
jgi:hypothetical protein